jgi:hypothetical protein
MRGLDAAAISVGELSIALNAEAMATNSVLPPQPGLAELAGAQPDRFASWLGTELRSGLDVAPQMVVNVRKPRHGTRPAPIVGIPERVAYRALVDRILVDDADLQRSSLDFVRFIQGPVNYVVAKAGPGRLLSYFLEDDEIRYVVKSDLSAFYQYVDHGILGRLLLARTTDVSLVDATIELLSEVEGRTFGLPQMLGASDRLSEVYAQLLQDQLLRRGLLVWRFNDDFRIGVSSFAAALEAIEALSEEARALGLIINEQKTVSPRFGTYAMAALGLNSLDDEVPVGERDDVEATVADYLDAFGDPDDAAGVLRDAVASEGGWNLGDVDQDEVSRLRRAIWSLAREADLRGIDSIVPLAIYVPSLTPALCRYAEVVVGEDQLRVLSAIDTLIGHASLGGWQRLWFCHLLRNTNSLTEDSGGDRTLRYDFAAACRSDRSSPVVRAEASLALAEVGVAEIGQMASALVTESPALASWYVLAASASVRNDRDEKVLKGIRGTRPLYAMLLDSTA